MLYADLLYNSHKWRTFYQSNTRAFYIQRQSIDISRALFSLFYKKMKPTHVAGLQIRVLEFDSRTRPQTKITMLRDFRVILNVKRFNRVQLTPGASMSV